MTKIQRCSFAEAQRAYDNRSNDFPDDPEMDCPICGKNVELQQSAYTRKIELIGTCENCGTECEYDNDQF